MFDKFYRSQKLFTVICAKSSSTKFISKNAEKFGRYEYDACFIKLFKYNFNAQKCRLQ